MPVGDAPGQCATVLVFSVHNEAVQNYREPIILQWINHVGVYRGNRGRRQENHRRRIAGEPSVCSGYIGAPVAGGRHHPAGVDRNELRC